MGSIRVAALCACLAVSTTARAQLPRPAPSALPQWAIDTSARLRPALATVAGIRLGMNESRVRSLLGHPDTSFAYESPVLDSARVLRYPTAEAVLNAAGVQTFRCWGRSCGLPGGIRIGSSLQAVVASLGRGHPGYGHQLSHSLFYYVGGCDCWLEVRFTSSLRVDLITLESDNS